MTIDLKSEKTPLVVPIIVLLVCLTFASTASYIIYRSVKKEVQREFDHFAQVSNLQLQREIDLSLESVIALKAYYDSSEHVSPKEFKIFSNELLKSISSVNAMAWIQKVSHNQIEEFESSLVSSGYPNFRVWETDDYQTRKSRTDRKFHFPITYLSPMEGNEWLHGQNVMSNKNRQEKLNLASDLGTIATEVVWPEDLPPRLQAYIPIYRDSGTQQTSYHLRKDLKGFVMSQHVIKTFVNQTLDTLKDDKRDVRLYLYDVTKGEDAPSLIHYPPQETMENSEYHDLSVLRMGIKRTESLIHLPGRVWKSVILPTPHFIKTYQSRSPLLIFIGGICFSLLMGSWAFFYSQSHRRARAIARLNETLDRKVKERTLQLEAEVKKVASQKRAVISIMEDFRQAQVREKQANENLKISNRELEQFAYIASHDLQEPLRKIISFSNLLQEEIADSLKDDPKRYFEFVIKASYRMRDQIQDLLEFSRAGQKELKLVATNLNDLVNEVVEMLEVTINENQATIEIKDLPTVNCAPRFMASVFQNLISNAIKFQAKDTPPKIVISAKESPDEWIVSVSDNGLGIDKEHSGKIFEIFRRLHSRDKYEGTGIGLAICNRVIHRHGGKIWLESEPGQGSIFHFTIPK